MSEYLYCTASPSTREARIACCTQRYVESFCPFILFELNSSSSSSTVHSYHAPIWQELIITDQSRSLTTTCCGCAGVAAEGLNPTAITVASRHSTMGHGFPNVSFEPASLPAVSVVETDDWEALTECHTVVFTLPEGSIDRTSAQGMLPCPKNVVSVDSSRCWMYVMHSCAGLALSWRLTPHLSPVLIAFAVVADLLLVAAWWHRCVARPCLGGTGSKVQQYVVNSGQDERLPGQTGLAQQPSRQLICPMGIEALCSLQRCCQTQLGQRSHTSSPEGTPPSLTD